MMKIIYIITITILVMGVSVASQFDELDKAPEGAHRGQMVMSVYTGMGTVIGTMKESEDSFLTGSTYTFTESDVTKMLMVNYLIFKFGLSFEYMPMDHIGIKILINNTKLAQRTIFGSQYQNWSKNLHNEYTGLLGASYHLTSRKPWDLSSTLYAGYSMGTFSPSPIAGELMTTLTADSSKSTSGAVVGLDLSFTAYFSGGAIMSLSTGWFYHIISLDSPVSQINPVTTDSYSNTVAQPFHDISVNLSIGYAFSN